MEDPDKGWIQRQMKRIQEESKDWPEWKKNMARVVEKKDDLPRVITSTSHVGDW